MYYQIKNKEFLKSNEVKDAEKVEIELESKIKKQVFASAKDVHDINPAFKSFKMQQTALISSAIKSTESKLTNPPNKYQQIMSGFVVSALSIDPKGIFDFINFSG